MSIEPIATYRLQLHAGFTLDDAAGIVDYLAALGVSHVYCSPYLQAAPGSTHGYDQVDPHRVNIELGGEEAHARLAAVLQLHGMGQMLDIVPNHMAITGPENPWWWDVLTNGPSSRYASYFDVEWNPAEARHNNEVLVPVLGDQYGRVLEDGQIRVELTPEGLFVRYGEHSYPVDPRSYAGLLRRAAERSGSDELAFLADAYRLLPLAIFTDRARVERRSRDQAVLNGLLRRLRTDRSEVEAALQGTVQELNSNPDELDAFLQEQNYRLAYWRITQSELGYRRFFDINTLMGLRMEDEDVFRDTHARVLKWLADDLLDGVRVDHPDGLRDPEGYFWRLQSAKPGAWIVIEKILEPGERLPERWPVAGTTGYDFMNRVNGLFVDPAGEAPLKEIYQRFTGRSIDYPALVHEKKIQVMSVLLGSDMARLVELFLRICEANRRYRDTTRRELRAVLTETAACLPVYRTYVRAGEQQVHESDGTYISAALEQAKSNRADIDPALFDFLGDILLLKVRGEAESELVMRFQQFTGPVMAKGVEDTVFYNYDPLISLNEVGGDPGHFGLPPREFHQACRETAARWPLGLLASTTHDTKRSEDVRARINVLSEIPEAWEQAVQQWARWNERYRSAAAPDRNDEYLLYQTLVGAWPIEEERLLQYMEKACREAKTHTSWNDPNPVYEQAVRDFTTGILANPVFRRDLEEFVARVRRPGQINALAQTLIKLTAPGVPDVYQGTELWSFALVDPDNRRPVDYAVRRALLQKLDGASPEQILAEMDAGLPKVWVIRQALHLRREHPDWFGAAAGYEPLDTDAADHLLAYRRGEHVVVAVPRLASFSPDPWGAASLPLAGGEWQNRLTGETFSGGSAVVAELFRRFPVALLAREA